MALRIPLSLGDSSSQILSYDNSESVTRNRRRMDVVIHYCGKRYIIELKIWHGERYNEKGEEQIKDYLDFFGIKTGYMLSFSFNKNKVPGIKRVDIGDRVVFEGVA